MQQYLTVLQNKALATENLSKALQNKIAAHEDNLAKYDNLKNAIENDEIDGDVEEAKQNLEQYEEILKNADEDLCKKLNKFDTAKYAERLNNLAKATSGNSKLNGGKKNATKKQTQPATEPPVVTASQGTTVNQSTAQTATPQKHTATVDGKQVEVIEEPAKKPMSTLAKIGIVLGVATLAGLGIAVAQNFNQD